ncbi:MAG: holo-[acyl-carrier-protein] synthase [Bacteroidetes bacterium]|nr:MAG: holo-[acyl-carrier-protein] synthase [Bacteroidota bacterium]
MIIGIGVDIIEIARIQESIDSYGERFLQKLFTEGEIAYCSAKQFPTQHYAARFAAKEAFAKAVSTGWSGDFEWKNVEVRNDPIGKPSLELYGKTAEALKGCSVFLSMSHSDSTVIAYVVIERNG